MRKNKKKPEINLPVGILRLNCNLTQQQIVQFREKWEEACRSNTASVVITSHDVEYIPLRPSRRRIPRIITMRSMVPMHEVQQLIDDAVKKALESHKIAHHWGQ